MKEEIIDKHYNLLLLNKIYSENYNHTKYILTMNTLR